MATLVYGDNAILQKYILHTIFTDHIMIIHSLYPRGCGYTVMRHTYIR